MDDDIIRSDATDRVPVQWSLTSQGVVAACDGTARLAKQSSVMASTGGREESYVGSANPIRVDQYER